MSITGLWEKMRPVLVPEISDSEIKSMRHIRPLIREDGTHWYRKIKGSDTLDPREIAFTWDAQPDDVAMAFSPLNKVEIMTFHKFGAPSFFKPSLAEVYAAIRRCCPDFRDVWYFYLHSDHLDVANVIGDCHWCRCTLFGSCDYFEPR